MRELIVSRPLFVIVIGPPLVVPSVIAAPVSLPFISVSPLVWVRAFGEAVVPIINSSDKSFPKQTLPFVLKVCPDVAAMLSPALK